MTPSRLLLLGAVVLVLAAWWWAGADRAGIEPARQFTAEQIAHAERYQTPRQVAYAVGTVLTLAVLAVLAFTPAGDRLLAPARRWPWPLGAIGAVAVVSLVLAAIRLPLSFWRGLLYERRWGFSTQTAAGWFGDWAKGLGITIAISGLAFIGFVFVVRALPRAWPVAAAAGAAVLTVALSFLSPVLIEPVFNRFQPLPDRALAAELRELSVRAGVPVRDVLVADASRRTTKENAYVSGFGTTRRLVLYDTLLRRASPEEVRVVAAHELGHRRLRHVEAFTAVGALGAAATVLVLWLLLRSAGVLAAARAQGPADPRVLPFLVLAVTVMALVAQPASNRLSRAVETAADRFALELTGERAAYVDTERGLALRNLA
ncbi:MAG: M48 family metallopeptidase, partial [Actinomycetota bacterium]|nr:M48 family metallopeptidase [Actinomycetota bacterium]